MKKQNKIWIFSLVIMSMVLILLCSCKKDKIPELTTTNASNIKQTTAISGGTITSDFNQASITDYGICWSTLQNPTISDSKTSESSGTASFISTITGLTLNTTYYIRAYATNSAAGTGYGDAISFTTQDYGTLTDIDGNVYHSVIIGTQTWMVENLKTTKYRDGSAIPNVTDNTAWSNLTTGAYCDYENTLSNSTTYGKLYNFYAVSDSRNIAPTGWHVPTDAEWTTLTTYLGGEYVAGNKLKEIGTTHWASPNTGATNETYFSALPGGYRGFNMAFYGIGGSGYWWSSTEINTLSAWSRDMVWNDSDVSRGNSGKTNAYSVRCVKD